MFKTELMIISVVSVVSDDDILYNKYGRRVRATSPITYRQSLADRFDEPWNTRYTDLSTRIDSAIRKNRWENYDEYVRINAVREHLMFHMDV